MTPMQYAEDRIKSREIYNNQHAQLTKLKKDFAEFVEKDKVVRNNMDILTKFGGANRLFTDAQSYKLKYQELLRKRNLSHNGKPVDEAKLKKLNQLLACTVTEEIFLEKLDDITENPEKYWHLFDN